MYVCIRSFVFFLFVPVPSHHCRGLVFLWFLCLTSFVAVAVMNVDAPDCAAARGTAAPIPVPRVLHVPQWLTSPQAAMELPLPATVWPLTRFEETAVVGRRSIALSQGAPPRVAVSTDDIDPLGVARAELRCGQLPRMSVKRYLPDETHITVSVGEALRRRGGDHRATP